MEDVSLYISIPSNRDWKGKFGSALASLISRLSLVGIEVEGYRLTNFYLRSWGNSSCLSIARQKFVDEMVGGGFTHWLSLDDDMTFPMDLVDRLLSHKKDVVSVNARIKCEEIRGSCLAMNGMPLDSTDKSGLEEIRIMGGAIFLAKIDTFRNISKPHFQVLWSPEHQDYVGEDVYFAALLKNHGVQLWCDHDTSHLVGHLGEYEYKFPALEAPKLKAVA